MKLTLTLHNKTYSVESEDQFDGQDLNELAVQFKGLLVNAGFHPNNVDELMNTDCNWFHNTTNGERRDQMYEVTSQTI